MIVDGKAIGTLHFLSTGLPALFLGVWLIDWEKCCVELRIAMALGGLGRSAARGKFQGLQMPHGTPITLEFWQRPNVGRHLRNLSLR